MGEKTPRDYADAFSLYPKIRFTDCENVAVYLGHSIASVAFERCSINTVTAPALRGELTFTDCHFHPDVSRASLNFYTVQSTLGTRFTHCTLHVPKVNGQADPETVDQMGFMEINKSLRHYHLNTALGNDILSHLKSQGKEPTSDFIAKLKAHHELEKEPTA